METQIITKEIKPLEKKVNKVLEVANTLVVEDKESEKKAVIILSNVNKGADEIKEKKEAITKPLSEALKNARALFKPLEDNIAEVKSIINRKLIDYSNKVETEAKEKEEKIEARVDKGTLKPETAVKKLQEIEEPKKSVETEIGKVTYRIIKKVEIFDENLIPREYLKVDVVKVNSVVKSGIEVPGAKLVEEKTIANSR